MNPPNGTIARVNEQSRSNRRMSARTSSDVPSDPLRFAIQLRTAAVEHRQRDIESHDIDAGSGNR